MAFSTVVNNDSIVWLPVNVYSAVEGTEGAYCHYPPSEWALAGEVAGAAASEQRGGVGQQISLAG